MLAYYILLALLLLPLAGNAAGVTNLVTNGDFENTAYGTGNSGAIATPVNGSGPITQNLTGWSLGYRSGSSTVSGLGLIFASGQGDNPNNGAFTDLYGPQNGVNNGLTANSGATTTGGPTGQNGGNFLALDADPGVNGTLSQTINGLTAGNTYILNFDWAAAELVTSSSSATNDALVVGFGNSSVTTQTISTANQGFFPWRQATYQFTATNTSQVLSFLAVGSPSGNPPTVLLDAVSLTIPEPAAWLTLLTAILAMAGSLHLRRRTARKHAPDSASQSRGNHRRPRPLWPLWTPPPPPTPP
jgi:hypothetical protein